MIDHYDSFEFEKLGTDGNGYLGSPEDWICYGEPFDGEKSVSHTLLDNYALYTPYPNPFNADTKLTFTLPENGNISLVIFDVNGREIARLMDGFYKAGIYESKFDGSELSSGVYFVKLSAGTFQQTQKLLLIK